MWPTRHPARRGGQPGGPDRTTGIGAGLETGTARTFGPSTPRTRVMTRGRRTAMVHDAARQARSDRAAEPTARPGAGGGGKLVIGANTDHISTLDPAIRDEISRRPI